MGILLLILVLLVAAGVFWALVVWALAVMLLRPSRMTDGQAAYLLERVSPGDLELPYEPLIFTVRDEHSGQPLKLGAWWIPAATPSPHCVVMIHGYADAKVGALAWAPTWHALDFNLLAIDLRAHGESEGTYSTGGYFERHDLDQLLTQIRNQRPTETASLTLFGVSLGGAVAVALAAMRDDLDAIVLDCPFADYRAAAIAHARFMRMPGPIFTVPALRLAEWLSGAHFDAVRPIDQLTKVRCACMVIHSESDPLVPETVIEQFARELAEQPSPHMHWRVAKAGHLQALAIDPDEYQRRLQTFLAMHANLRPAEIAERPAPTTRSISE
jgi:pimeloyl-ACP methyl ester carboxylesterase